MGRFLAGTKYLGEFEERLKNLMDEIKKCGNIILFLDEVHTLVGAGAAVEGGIDAANILKPALARGELQVSNHIATLDLACSIFLCSICFTKDLTLALMVVSVSEPLQLKNT